MTEECKNLMKSGLDKALKNYEKELLELKEYSTKILKIVQFCIESFDFLEEEYKIEPAILHKFGEILGYPSECDVEDIYSSATHQISICYDKKEIDNIPSAFRYYEKAHLINRFLEENECSLDWEDDDDQIIITLEFDHSILYSDETGKKQEEIFQKVLSLNNNNKGNK